MTNYYVVITFDLTNHKDGAYDAIYNAFKTHSTTLNTIEEEKTGKSLTAYDRLRLGKLERVLYTSKEGTLPNTTIIGISERSGIDINKSIKAVFEYFKKEGLFDSAKVLVSISEIEPTVFSV